MKRIFPAALLLLTVLTACGYTAYLWQKKFPDVSEANIERVADNQYYVNTIDETSFSVSSMDGQGNSTPLLKIPKENAYRINLKWVDDHSFYAPNMFGPLSFVTFEEGIRWRLGDTEFSRAAGRSVHLLNSNAQNTPQGSALMYGSATLINEAGLTLYRMFIAEIDQQGVIQHLRIAEDTDRSYTIQILGDGYVLLSRYNNRLSELTGLNGMLQHYDGQHQLMHQIPLQRTQYFKLAIDNEVFIASQGSDADNIGVYNWDNVLLRSFPVEIDRFYEFGKMSLTAQNELLLLLGVQIEKRSLSGEQRWYYRLHNAYSPLDKLVHADDGTTALAYNNIDTSRSGVELEMSKSENGSVLFKGTGLYSEKRRIEYQIFQPQLAKTRLITQNGFTTHYQVEYACGDDWCAPSVVNTVPGICKIFDIELLDQGGLITLGQYCDENAPGALVISRY